MNRPNVWSCTEPNLLDYNRLLFNCQIKSLNWLKITKDSSNSDQVCKCVNIESIRNRVIMVEDKIIYAFRSFVLKLKSFSVFQAGKAIGKVEKGTIVETIVKVCNSETTKERIGICKVAVTLDGTLVEVETLEEIEKDKEGTVETRKGNGLEIRGKEIEEGISIEMTTVVTIEITTEINKTIGPMVTGSKKDHRTRIRNKRKHVLLKIIILSLQPFLMWVL